MSEYHELTLRLMKIPVCWEEIDRIVREWLDSKAEEIEASPGISTTKYLLGLSCEREPEKDDGLDYLREGYAKKTARMEPVKEKYCPNVKLKELNCNCHGLPIERIPEQDRPEEELAEVLSKTYWNQENPHPSTCHQMATAAIAWFRENREKL